MIFIIFENNLTLTFCQGNYFKKNLTINTIRITEAEVEIQIKKHANSDFIH